MTFAYIIRGWNACKKNNVQTEEFNHSLYISIYIYYR